MQLEQLIRQFEHIESLPQLDAVLNQMGNVRPYTWCCFMVQDIQRVQLGVVPAEYAQQVATLDLRQLTAEKYKPYWQSKPGCSRIPFSTLYVPMKTQGGHYGCLLLGVDSAIAVDLPEKLCWYWQILATYVYDCFRRCTPAIQAHRQLTKREQECLHWVSHGKTSWETAKILGISERTVNFHISNSLVKTGCANRQQLTAIYMKIN